MRSASVVRTGRRCTTPTCRLSTERRRGEGGTVTAEFASVIPAVILVLACVLGALQLVGQQLRLQDAAADAARIAARGEPQLAAHQAGRLVPGAVLTSENRDGLVCVRLRAPAGVAGVLLGAVALTASGCALDASS